MPDNEAPAYAGMPKEQLHREIEEATSIETLDQIATELHAVGYSREGLTSAKILERKAELGAELTEEEEKLVELANARIRRAADLPAASVQATRPVPPSEE